MSSAREQLTTNLFLLEDLVDRAERAGLLQAIWTRFAQSQTGSTITSSGLTRISSAAPGPSAPSCPGPWSARHFGSHLSTSPTEADQRLSRL